jgi:hypothetical protein
VAALGRGSGGGGGGDLDGCRSGSLGGVVKNGGVRKVPLLPELGVALSTSQWLCGGLLFCQRWSSGCPGGE